MPRRPPHKDAPGAGGEHFFRARAEKTEDRLDRFLADALAGEGLSREKVKRLILAGKAAINGVPALSPKARLAPGDEAALLLPRASSPLTPEDGELAVLYRDEVLAVLNKPAGLTVHPAPGETRGTLAQRLLAHFPELAAQEGERPGIVHRLDKDTSGLMLVALTEECRLALAALFARREIFKEYLALCHGVPHSPLRINAPIGRDPANKTRMAVVPGGREALSEARLLHAGPLGRFSLMAVRIFSGRTHQVRVHMRHAGHPLWGDKVYATAFREREKAARKQGCAPPARQMLHAWKLAFLHPLPHKAGRAVITGALERRGEELCFLCPPPEDFALAGRCLSRRTLAAVITGMPGCGKSALLDILRGKGLPVFSADACVAALYAPGGDGRRILRQRFGSRFAPDDDKAPVNKAALGAAMAADEALRREVEALVHPLVWHAAQSFVAEQEEAGEALAFLEIPLYLESGRRRQERADETRPVLVGVRCPFAARAERLQRRRGWSPETIARMESWQWPEEKKMAACDLIADNSRSLEDLRAEAEKLLAALLGAARQREEEAAAAMAKIWNAWS